MIIVRYKGSGLRGPGYKRGETNMIIKLHIEYDDFGPYVEVEENGTLYAVRDAEEGGEQKSS